MISKFFKLCVLACGMMMVNSLPTNNMNKQDSAATKPQSIQTETKDNLGDVEHMWFTLKISVKQHKMPSMKKDGTARKPNIEKFLSDVYKNTDQTEIRKTLGKLMVLNNNVLPVGDYILDHDGGLIPLKPHKQFELKDRAVVGMYPSRCYVFKGKTVMNNANRLTALNPKDALLLREYQA